MHYSFRFVHEGMPGHVEVYPAGAFVTWAGGGFQIEAAGPALAATIFRARLTLSRNFRRSI